MTNEDVGSNEKNLAALTRSTFLHAAKKKHRLRAAFRIVSFLVIILGYSSYYYIVKKLEVSDSSDSAHNKVQSYGIRQLKVDVWRSQRFLQSVEEGVNSANCEILSIEMLVLSILGVLYMFLALAISCDEFFVPALEEMASKHRLNLSMDVAGATLMAAGGSAPELFTALAGTFQKSEIGFGTIVGSAVFNVLFVIGTCSIFSKEVLTLTWWPLFRDCSFYVMGLLLLAIFVGITTPGKIVLWESITLFACYFLYVLLMKYNRVLYKKITGKEFEDEDEDKEKNEKEKGDESESKEANASSKSLMSTNSKSIASTPCNYTHWHGTFRTGILTLLKNPDSMIDSAGIGIVGKLTGDVHNVFKFADKDGNGYIDKEELEMVFIELDVHMTAAELKIAYAELDENGDGKICKSEFTNWYMRSEKLMRSKVKSVFDMFDKDNSGSIDRHELKALLLTIDPKTSDADIDGALEECHKTGSKDEISYDEFTSWYVQSLMYDRQKEEVAETMGGICSALAPPKNWSCVSWILYVVYLPIVATLSFTVPDVRRDGLGKWCYVSFLLSISWIGIYSTVMVTLTEMIGKTLGIPSMVMGLTFLAAGTSVPDLLSSVIVARRGEGDMAVSSSIGSNIFDILVGLPFPWLLYTLISADEFVTIGADGVWSSILILIGMIILIILTVHCSGWKLSRQLGCVMFLFYFIFLAQAVYFELPFTDICA